MPPLSLFDDLDVCLDENLAFNSTYCVVDVSIQPNANSTVWRTIEVCIVIRK